jgi:hypothetical protein
MHARMARQCLDFTGFTSSLCFTNETPDSQRFRIGLRVGLSFGQRTEISARCLGQIGNGLERVCDAACHLLSQRAGKEMANQTARKSIRVGAIVAQEMSHSHCSMKR